MQHNIIAFDGLRADESTAPPNSMYVCIAYRVESSHPFGTWPTAFKEEKAAASRFKGDQKKRVHRPSARFLDGLSHWHSNGEKEKQAGRSLSLCDELAACRDCLSRIFLCCPHHLVAWCDSTTFFSLKLLMDSSNLFACIAHPPWPSSRRARIRVLRGLIGAL